MTRSATYGAVPRKTGRAGLGTRTEAPFSRPRRAKPCAEAKEGRKGTKAATLISAAAPKPTSTTPTRGSEKSGRANPARAPSGRRGVGYFCLPTAPIRRAARAQKGAAPSNACYAGW